MIEEIRARCAWLLVVLVALSSQVAAGEVSGPLSRIITASYDAPDAVPQPPRPWPHLGRDAEVEAAEEEAEADAEETVDETRRPVIIRGDKASPALLNYQDNGCQACGECDTCQACNAGQCDDPWCCGRGGGCERGGTFFIGAEWLLVQPRMSQAVAEVRRSVFNDGVTSSVLDESIQFPFHYNSGFRAFVGYRLLDCAGDVQFTYWRFTGGGSITDGPADIVGETRIIAAQLNNNPEQGEFLRATQSVEANIYDLDFGKSLRLGGATCTACGCPLWDVRWLAGVRAASIRRTDDNAVFDSDGFDQSYGNISARFTGAGPHAGVQGRRYLGQNARWAAYSKATGAPLVGNIYIDRTLTIPSTDLEPTQITRQTDRFMRLVPVIDLEVGLTWQVACRTFVSGGWLCQAWWDMGSAEQLCCDNGSFGSLDSANILGFNGLFIRGEMLF